MTLFEPQPESQSELQPEPGVQRAANLEHASDVERQRIKLTVAYDGTDFHGFAEQREQRTVAGVLRDAIERIARREVPLTCAGRTDTGVHAWGQVVHVDVPTGVAPDRLAKSLHSMLAPEVVVRHAEVVSSDFDARFSATSRVYRYTVVNREVADPFSVRTAWWVERPLDLRRLRAGADAFIGTHDFSAFCRDKKDPNATNIRRIIDSTWTDLGDGMLRFEIEGTAFCWQMVRSVVGTVVR